MRLALAPALLAATLLPAVAAEVGVSVQISQPGVYGRIDIGRFPQPSVVVTRPVVVAPPPAVVAVPQPVYMWVPPGHRRNWAKHCAKYGACGVPVYFVQDRWYREHVMAGHGDDGGRGKGHGRGHGHGNRGG